MSGWTPPPAPGGPPPGGYGYGAPGPYGPAMPPPRKSSAGLVIGLLVGGLVIVVVLVVAVVVLVNLGGRHEISTPSAAGGYSRDYSTENRISSQLNSQRSIIRRASGYKISTVDSAVYGTGSTKYLFVGGEGEDIDPDDLFRRFDDAMEAETSSNVSTYTYRVSNAGGDGKAACASIRNRQTSRTYSTAICAWATKTTFGTIMPVPDTGSLSSSRNHSYLSVAGAMRRIRDDVES